MPKRGGKGREQEPVEPPDAPASGPARLAHARRLPDVVRGARICGDRRQEPLRPRGGAAGAGQDQQRAAAQARLHANPRKLIEAACAGDIDPARRSRGRNFAPSAAAFTRARATPTSRRSLCAAPPQDQRRGRLSPGGRLLRRAQLRLRRRADQAQRHGAGSGSRRSRTGAGRRTTRAGSSPRSSATCSRATPCRCSWTRPGFAPRSRLGALSASGSLHLGAGKNIRTLDTPFPLSKLMAHHFLQAPDDYSDRGGAALGPGACARRRPGADGGRARHPPAVETSPSTSSGPPSSASSSPIRCSTGATWARSSTTSTRRSSRRAKVIVGPGRVEGTGRRSRN